MLPGVLLAEPVADARGSEPSPPGVAASAPETTGRDTPAAEAPTLSAVRVQASRMPAAVQADPIRAQTTVNDAALRQRQAAAVFEVLDEIPGIAAQGGPRASGMRFNVRGYTDSEDIRIELDGIGKGFEKYRFGGTFIEPELIKSVDVRRGAQIESPAGALGGTVSVRTRDAADLLRPGQTWGARSRLGWASNNHETHGFVALYGRPSQGTDVLMAHSRRASEDLRLADGERLPLSSTQAGSTLLKGSWSPGGAWLHTASWLRYDDQGLQPYDTTGGVPGTFGQVRRHIDDETLSLQSQWADEERGLSWQTTLGQARTRVRDHMAQGWSVFSSLADVDDDVDHRQRTLDSRLSLPLWRPDLSAMPDESGTTPGNPSAFANWQADVRIGLQLGDTRRHAWRVTGSAALNAAAYPDGYNPAQPPGQQTRMGGYLQLDVRHAGWQFLPGTRWDHFSTTVEGPNALVQAQAGLPTRIEAQRASPSLTVAHAWAPQGLTLFATVAHAFRPPLLDEAYARSGYGACNNASLLRLSEGGVPGYAGLVNVTPASGMCADALVPETSRARQLGAHWSRPRALGPDSHAELKLTAFDDRTRHVLESLMAEMGGSGELVQPGTEHRWGLELEGTLRMGAHSIRLAGHRMQGTQFDGLVDQPLLTVPADRLQISLGRQQSWGEWGLRWQQVWARRYYTDTTQLVTARQPGHRLLGAWLHWRINPFLAIDVAGENLANQSYRLDNGSASLGVQGAGRNVRVALSARY